VGGVVVGGVVVGGLVVGAVVIGGLVVGAVVIGGAVVVLLRNKKYKPATIPATVAIKIATSNNMINNFLLLFFSVILLKKIRLIKFYK
jgi:hypothetical protein